jgi:hypothetical protein
MQTVTKIKDLHNHLAKRLGPGKHPFELTSKSGNGEAVITSGGFSIRLSGQDKAASTYVAEKLLLPVERRVFVIENGIVSTVTEVSLESFKLKADKYELYPGEKVALELTEVTDGYVLALEPTYIVSPKGLAEINEAGELVAIAKGKVKITAKLENITDVAQFEILKPLPVLKGFKVTTEVDKLVVGEECRVLVTDIDEEGYTPVSTTYSIDNNAVAAINPDGIVTAIAEGSVTITVAIDGIISELVLELVAEVKETKETKTTNNTKK